MKSNQNTCQTAALGCFWGIVIFIAIILIVFFMM